jgi:Ni/Fe-hydrogenase 1 B-type cytochrome subunit
MENQKEISTPSFRKQHSIAIRLWHWVSFIVITGSLLTVLLAKTLLSNINNVATVQNGLQADGVSITTDQAKHIVHDFRENAWNWHVYFGYVLAGLFLYRVILEVFQNKNQRFLVVVKNVRAYLRQPSGDKKTGLHYLRVKFLYALFYITLGTMTVTGLVIKYYDHNKAMKPLKSLMKDIHSVGLYVVLGFIVLHLGGVILSELGNKYKGIVSDMINGGDKE